METKADRPVAVTVIGWVLIAVAGLSIVSSAMSLASLPRMEELERRMPSDWVEALRPTQFLTRHFTSFLALQLAAAAFVLIASIRFLKLRAWARTALEVVAWLNLLYLVASGVAAMLILPRIVAQFDFPVPEGHPSPLPYVMFAVVTVTFIWLVATIGPTAVIIYFLRSKRVREAVS